MSGRVLTWIGGTIVVMAAAGTAACLWALDLSGASEVAGVVSGFVGLAGLGVAAYGVIQAHKDALAAESHGPDGEQSVTKTTARSVTQVKGVTGNVRIGRSSSTASPAPPGAPASALSPPTPTPSGQQTVTDANIRGDATQVDGVGGDLDIDR